MDALVKISGPPAETITALFDGVLSILEAACDETTKVAALESVGRFTPMQTSITSSQFYGEAKSGIKANAPE